MSDTINTNYIDKLKEEPDQTIQLEGPLDENKLQLLCAQDQKNINFKKGCSPKLTYEFVTEIFKNKGCQLLEEIYVNVRTIMRYICVCGNESKKTYKCFLQCSTCPKCTIKTPNKLTYEFIKQTFEDKKCQLLEKIYINSETHMRYICKCGDESIITYQNFKKSPNCRKCGTIAMANKRRLPYEFIKSEFEKEGCKLISETYHNRNELLDYICKCGNPAKTSYSHFNNAGHCRKCGIIEQHNSMRHSYEYIRQIFVDNDCILLEKEYKNALQKLKYQCSCGDIGLTSLSDFRNGNRCGCLKNKSIGEIQIKFFLESLNLQYIFQKKYANCKNKRQLSFDFLVDNKFIIEFDGGQHFEPITKFHGIDGFKNQQKRDTIKNKYTIQNKIPILRISYKERKYILLILKLYLSLIKKNIAPPILFTNKGLYQTMYSKIKHLTTANVFIQI